MQYLFVYTLATFNRYVHVSYNTIADHLDQTVLYTCITTSTVRIKKPTR